MTLNQNACVAYRLKTGDRLISTLRDSHALLFNQDRLKSNYEIKLVNDFFQNVQSYLDCWDGLEPIDQFRIQLELDHAILTLEKTGLLVYGCQRQEDYQTGHSVIDNWQVAYLLIIHEGNPIATQSEQAIADSNHELHDFIVIQPR